MSEEYQINDSSCERRYFASIPNIIYDMGLTTDQIAVYGCLKRIAGDHGKSFISNVKLSEKLGISRPTLIKIKESLEKPFDFLGGKSLITIQKRSSIEKGDQTDIVTIVDIWDENVNHVATLKNKIPCKGDLHPPVKEIDTPCKAALHKEEPIKKNLSKKNIIIPNPSPPVFDAPTADDDLSFSDKDKEDLNNFTPEQIAEAKKRTKENCNSPNPKTRVKYFFTTLSRLPKPKPPKLSVYDELKQYFCNGKEYKGAECFLNSEGIAFQRGNFLQDQMKIDKFWSWPRFGDMCLRFSIPFKRASS
jgi:hypothetical protein